MKTAFALAAALGSACGDNLPEPVTSTSSVYDVTWAWAGRSDSPGVPGPVDCTALISHPCAFVMYARRLTLAEDGTSITWDRGYGGADANGVPASQRAPWIDPQMFTTSDALVLDERGDDSGLRHAAELAPLAGDGWEGDVTWSLFTVAGNTTFHVVITGGVL